MCMEDIRIMRRTTKTERRTPLTEAFQIVAPYDATRVAVIIGVDGPQEFEFCLKPEIVDDGGISVATASGPIILDLQRHGAIVFGPILARDPGGMSLTAVVIDSCLAEQ